LKNTSSVLSSSAIPNRSMIFFTMSIVKMTCCNCYHAMLLLVSWFQNRKYKAIGCRVVQL
jgi:hypothetical protein